MHLLAQATLRTNAEAIADDQHPDHQFRINRGTTNLAVERLQVPAQAGQVNEAVDRAQQMIGRNVTLDAELIEQRLLHHRPLAHHRRILRQSGGVNQDFEPPATPTFSTQSTQSGRSVIKAIVIPVLFVAPMAECCLRARRRMSLTVRSAASFASIGCRLIVFLHHWKR